MTNYYLPLRIATILPLLILSSHSFALSGDSTRTFFKHNYNGSLSISQQESSDWMQGDRSSFDLKASIRQLSTLSLDNFCLSATSHLQLGVLRESGAVVNQPIFQSTDNQFSSEFKAVAQLGWLVNPFVNLSLRSPITESFRQLSTTNTRSANFWDPVTTEQSCGLHYCVLSLKGRVSVRFGANAQQIRSCQNSILTDNLSTTNLVEKYKSTASVECAFNSQLSLDSSISFIASYQTRKNIHNNDAWQLKFDNELRVTIWKVFGVSVIANFVYDESLTKKVQFKQSTMFGFLFDY